MIGKQDVGRSDGLAKKLFQKLISLCSDFLVTSKAIFFFLMETDYRKVLVTTQENHLKDPHGPASENNMT